MKEDIGKFICSKCHKITTIIYNKDDSFQMSLFRARKENGKRSGFLNYVNLLHLAQFIEVIG